MHLRNWRPQWPLSEGHILLLCLTVGGEAAQPPHAMCTGMPWMIRITRVAMTMTLVVPLSCAYIMCINTTFSYKYSEEFLGHYIIPSPLTFEDNVPVASHVATAGDCVDRF